MEEIKMIDNIQSLNENEIQDVNGGAYVGPCFVYIVRRGDCLSVLAQRYGTTVRTLCEINNIPNPDFIREGQKLLIPYRG
jgi:FOG: LysM repeat